MNFFRIFKIMIVMIICMSSIIVFSACGTKNNELSQQTKIQLENADLKSKVVEMQKDIINIKSNAIDYTNKSNFQWMIDDTPWDKIIIQNSNTNEYIELIDSNFLKQFKLSKLIAPMYKKDNIDDIVEGEIEPYVYSFVKDQKIFSMNVISEDIIKIDENYYTVKGDISSLGRSYLSAPKSIKISNLITQIRMSPIYSYEYNMNNSKNCIRVYSFEKRNIINIANYLVSNKVSSIDKLPTKDLTMQHRMKFYYYGSEVFINIYVTQDNKNYMEVTDGKSTQNYIVNDGANTILSVVR